MKIVNNSIKKALTKPTTTRKGRILVDNIYYDVYNIVYYAEDYDEGRVIGNAISTQLDFDIPFYNMPKFDKFKYYDGILTENGFEYIDMGTFTIFDEKDNDNFSKHITSFDNLINFNAPFELNSVYPKTMFEELQNICQQANVELENEEITNGDFIIKANPFINGENLKAVLKAILSLSGDIAVIKNDKLKLLLEEKTDFSIDKSQHTPVVWKRKSYGINQVIIGESQIEGEYVIRQDEADIKENGIHKLTINDNPYAYNEEKRNLLVDNLFNKVKGFGYIPYELKGEWFSFLEIGDIITIDENETRVLRINGKNPNALESEMSAPAIIDSAIDFIDNTEDIKNQLRRTERIVDKANQTITDVVEQVDGQDEKISQVTQTVDELEQKINTRYDLTISGDTINNMINFANITDGPPLSIKIHPISENISYLYPSKNTFPSNSTFPKEIRILRFENIKTQEIFDYELPNDLLFLNSNVYDEFEFDFENKVCHIIKRCAYNVEKEVYELEQPIVEEYDFPIIILTKGDYNIYLPNYELVYIYLKMVIQNEYTNLFATNLYLDSSIRQTQDKIESEVSQVSTLLDKEVETLDSKITQTAKEINLEVSKKVGENEIISKINQSAEQIQIEANKISLIGKEIALTSDDIIISSNNFNVDKNGNLTCSNANITGGQMIISQDESNRQTPIILSQVYENNNYRGQMGGAGTSYYRNNTTGVQLLVSPNSGNGTLYVYNTSNTNEYNSVTPTGIRTTSDIRYKEEITNINQEISLNIINNLTPIVYKYKGGNEYHRGLSAQEVKDVLENNNIFNQIYSYEYNEVNDEERYSLNYSELIPDLINCIKFLNIKIENMQQEIQNLKNNINFAENSKNDIINEKED